tara:strand:+ start:2748 stop:4346 length:1599 start_codon:yes stop_codon:yes gene_type:complete
MVWTKLFRNLLAALCLVSVGAQAAALKEIAAPFTGTSFSAKSAAVEQVVASGEEGADLLLRQLMDGNLYFRADDKRLVAAQKSENGFVIEDAFTGEPLGEVGRWDVRPVAINNAIRGQLRAALAIVGLSNPNPEVREQSVRRIMRDPDPATLPALEARIADEDDRSVRALMQDLRRLLQLDSNDPALREKAARELSGSLQSPIRNKLRTIAAEDPEAQVRLAAEQSLENIATLRKVNQVAENLFFGIGLGSVLLLAAIGLAITFGVMGVINMAHGEMIMLGAYTTFVVQQLMPQHIGASLFVAIPAAFAVSGLAGILIERLVIRHLYGRPLETLLATFGISLILQQGVRSIFGSLNQSVQTPDWMSGSLIVNGALSLTYNRITIILFSFAVLFVLLLVLRKSFFGLQMRAVTQNRAMASSMGVRTGWVDALTFGLGSGIAGIAGVALSQLTNVGPNLGQQYIIDSFLVVVFGGVGNLWGALVGAMTLGIANKVIEPFAGAVLAKVLVLIAIILFIQKRPRGLFALKGRSVEN